MLRTPLAHKHFLIVQPIQPSEWKWPQRILDGLRHLRRQPEYNNVSGLIPLLQGNSAVHGTAAHGANGTKFRWQHCSSFYCRAVPLNSYQGFQVLLDFWYLRIYMTFPLNGMTCWMALVLPLYTFRIKPEDEGEFIIEDAAASEVAQYFPSMMRSLRLLFAFKLVRIPPRINLSWASYLLADFFPCWPGSSCSDHVCSIADPNIGRLNQYLYHVCLRAIGV